MIHAIGDSHSWMYRPFATVHHVGGRTMHHIGMHGCDLHSLGVIPGDTLIFVFGEIDCRCHMGRIADAAKIRLENIIVPTVMLYCNRLAEYDREYAKRTLVSCIVPPSAKGDAPSVPFYGTLAERVAITKQTNECLRKECEHRSLGFLDFYDHYALQDGSLNPEMSDGLVHIAEKCYIAVQETFEREIL